jgi:DNA repair protein SbcC/Rad50
MSNLDDALQLSVTDFRSIAGTVTVQLDAPIILIHGPNGSGKTSLLSALELALTGDIRSMRDDDTNFARHIVHEGASEAKVAITGRRTSATGVGSFAIANGVLTGKPFLDARDRKFFTERCYLAQSMLGRLLDIYQKSKVDDGESALTQFVKDLLGLSHLDALVDGLHDAGHKSRTKTLVPEYQAFEKRIERTTQDIAQLTTELSQLNQNRATVLAPLNLALASLFPNETPDSFDLGTVGDRLRALSTDNVLVEATRRLTELRSLNSAWTKLPKDADASERTDVEGAELAAVQEANAWRASTGVQLEELIVSLRTTFPDLPSWSSTDPASAAATASQRVMSELTRIKSLLDRDEAAAKRENELNESISKEEARSQLVDSQLAGVAKDAGDFAGALAALLPHVHTEDCPVCGRDFSQVSPTEPLSVHLQKTIARLTADAGKLSELSKEKSSSSGRLAQLRRELGTLRSQRIAEDAKASAIMVQANMSEAKVVLDRLAVSAANGTVILTHEASLRGRLANFRERDRSASDLLNSLIRIAGELSRQDLVNEPFDGVFKSLVEQVQANVTRLNELQSQKSVASQSLQTVLSTDQRRTIVSGELSRTRDTLTTLKAAVAELEKLKAQANMLRDTAQSGRTSIVRRVFNDSLNKLWRDLFIRLAPTEQFVPAFKVPETDSKDFAKLETVHRNGTKGGTPGSMLSAGNLNTAALTLFLALHFSVGARLPWLVLDDPVQSMDEVHIAQFAALLRTISRAHGTKVVIAVHERTLFDYLKLELSPAFEKDRLLALELRRTVGEPTRIVPDLVTYLVDAVAA